MKKIEQNFGQFQLKLTIKDGLPSPLNGSEGSFSLRKLKKGIFLFVFYSKQWWKVTQLTKFTSNGSTVIRNQTQSSAMADESFSNLVINGKTKINPLAATSDTDKFLVSDNKEIKYRTGAQILSDLGITAGEIIDWTGASAGTIHATNYTDTNTNQLTTFTVSATTDSNATTISQGDDLMFTAGTGIACETTADGTVTITGSTASDTVKGVVELATSAETNTGTDATRAVTPDGLDAWEGSEQIETLGEISTGSWNADVFGAGSIPNLPASRINSGTFADSRIAASNVTQHEASIDAVGVLDGGSITSNFGTINNGASAITTTGVISGGSFNHFMDTQIHNYNSTLTAFHYIPFGGSQTDSTSTADTMNDQTLYIAPYDGYVVKLILQSATGLATDAGATKFYIRVNGTLSTRVTETIADETSLTVSFGGSDSTFGFDAGDRIRIGVDPVAAMKDVTATSVWRYTI